MALRQNGMGELGELALTNQLGRTAPRFRPGFGGAMQHPTDPGWHALGHAGAIEGRVLADYSVTRQHGTQAGSLPMIRQIYGSTAASR